MLIKWIKCRVPDPAAFDRGQRAWVELRGLPGFLGQGGGWSRRESGLAHIFGCWADRRSYNEFMAGEHDRIAPAQAGTYHQITVDIFEHRLDIAEQFPADFADASLMRLAHGVVRPGHQAHAMRAQAEVWNPGMAGAPGMLRGVFAQRDESQFLVLSMWRSATDHERYLSERYPELRRRSGAADDLNSITGDVIDLEPSWSVPV